MRMDSFVSRHLKGVSRTYALLIPMLPRGLDDAVGLAYLLMRVVDTLEDSGCIDDVQRRRRIEFLDAELGELGRGAIDRERLDQALHGGIGESPAETALLADADGLLARIAALEPTLRGATVECARKMIAGVVAMLDRSAATGLAYPAVRDSRELREYCYHVAGVVGEMLCAMIGHHLRSPSLARLSDLAVELGIGLQLVNILKDALADSKKGRRYLPVAADGSLSHAEIYRAVLAEARTSLERGAEFVMALPATAKELRSFCGLPIAWGAMTLARAERDQSAAKIGRDAITSTIQRFSMLGGDDPALRRWLVGLIRTPHATPA
jgi:farnesyl-diphosphate farnesyltransferase